MRFRAGRSVPAATEASYAAVPTGGVRSDTGFPHEIRYMGCEWGSPLHHRSSSWLPQVTWKVHNLPSLHNPSVFPVTMSETEASACHLALCAPLNQSFYYILSSFIFHKHLESFHPSVSPATAWTLAPSSLAWMMVRASQRLCLAHSWCHNSLPTVTSELSF